MGKEIIAEIIAETLSKFEENNLNYAVLRNYENAFRDTPKDIDLLIDEKHEERIISIIKGVCNNRILLMHDKVDHKRTVISILLKSEYGNDQDEVVFSFDLNKYLTLKFKNIHCRLNGFGLKITINDLTLEKKRFDQYDLDFNILGHDQEIIFLMTHMLSKKKVKYLNKVNSYLLKRGKNPIGDIKNDSEIQNRIQDLLDASSIKKANQILKNCLIFFNTLKFKLFAYRASRVIYFSGPDGSGKSTSYLWTMEYLQKLKVKYYPLQGLQIVIMYVTFIYKFIKKGGKIKKYNVLTNVGRLGYSSLKRDRNTGKLSWALRRRIGLLTGLLEICIVGRFFVFIKRLTGHVIIVEESPFDIFVKRHRPRVKLLENKFLPIIPMPDLGILCVASEESIFNRKPELEKQEVKDYYQRINSLYSQKKGLLKKNLSTDISLIETRSDLASILRNVLE